MSEWLTAKGTDYCEFCEADYHQETGYYCWECDRPLCATCVVTALKPANLLCPECDIVQQDRGK